MLGSALTHIRLFYADPPAALASATEAGRRLRVTTVLLLTLVMLAPSLGVAASDVGAPISPGERVFATLIFLGPILYVVHFLVLAVDARLLEALTRFVRSPMSHDVALGCSTLFMLGSLPLSIAYQFWSASFPDEAASGLLSLTPSLLVFNAFYIVLLSTFLARALPALGRGGALAFGIVVTVAELLVMKLAGLVLAALLSGAGA